MTGQGIQQVAICYQWFKQRLILSERVCAHKNEPVLQKEPVNLTYSFNQSIIAYIT